MAKRAYAGPPLSYKVLWEEPDDGKRYELFDGDMVVTLSPSYEHQNAVKRMLVVLHTHVEREGLGEVLTAPFDVVFSERNVVQPDLLYIAKGRLGIIRGVVRGAPDLCVEVVSEATEGWDRLVRRRFYSRFGVRHYWLVDPTARNLTELVHRGRGYRQRRVWIGKEEVRPELFPGLAFPVAALWG